MRDTSIRTPAWGVTWPQSRAHRSSDFNSHPRVGVTSYNSCILQNTHFNSHPRVGGDKDLFCQPQQQPISIRTPAWGVTFADNEIIPHLPFQFAPPRGG